MVYWQWSSFNELSTLDLYRILQARLSVFAVEQQCAYQDCDDLDLHSWHLIGWDTEGDNRSLLAYLRVVHAGKKYPEPSIGRVLTTSRARGTGLGKALTSEAILRTEQEYPRCSIRISAQQRLENFYSNYFGFVPVSEPYIEDGIPHIEMLRKPED